MATRVETVAVQPLATRALASAASYVVIYGVTFAFFAPPATRLAASGYAALDATSVTFALLLVAALTVTFGATIFGYSVGWKVESDVRKRRMSETRGAMEFAVLGTLLALATAAVFIFIVTAGSGVSLSLVGAAALGLAVPGIMAACCTRSVVDHVAAAKRDIFATSLSALVVIVLVNYLIVGSLPSMADLPQLFGL
ncbi:hypothetical protein LGT39_11950 [Demequina sp. TTPB684]|uniref:hypothetical protein n=1 Tax=unclassified Demequina TaxID=2620311 RepID=UPI001CF1B124|nr:MULTISPECIES: hypothetical protein [unclassified Demequina]MCB2413555.1 hypothetical protein [Demequina sp. TTPB684]UPU87225.1 hypothetical protein LGT36_008035 [Demequina sp. TMPB413]